MVRAAAAARRNFGQQSDNRIVAIANTPWAQSIHRIDVGKYELREKCSELQPKTVQPKCVNEFETPGIAYPAKRGCSAWDSLKNLLLVLRFRLMQKCRRFRRSTSFASPVCECWSKRSLPRVMKLVR